MRLTDEVQSRGRADGHAPFTGPRVMEHPRLRRGHTRPVATIVDAGTTLGDISGRLRDAQDVPALWTAGLAETLRHCQFERGVVACMDGARLIAAAPPGHDCTDPSQQLARLIDAGAIDPDRGGTVARMQRDASTPAGPDTGAVAEALGLGDHVIAPIAPEGRTVALLLVDRADRPVVAADRDGVALFAHLIGEALERLVMRERLRCVSDELGQLMSAAKAVLYESLEAPIGRSTALGSPTLFVTAGAQAADDVAAGLTPKEREVAELMTTGRSNREIGQELHMAPDTVKDHVARIARKLGACNRVEAAARFAAARGRG